MKDTKKLSLILVGLCISVGGIVLSVFSRANAIAENASTGSKALYAAGLIAVIIGITLFLKGVLPQKQESASASRPVTPKTLTLAALMAALCYIGFAFFKIDIPIGTERTAFHFGNVFCVLAALFLGGLWGGMAGAVGMTFGDLLTGYVTSAPKTFFLKLCIGLIVGLFAHRIFKLGQETDAKKITGKAAVSAAAGMVFNVIFDPIVGYFYKTYLFGIPQDIAVTLAKISAGTTLVNAVVAVIAATLFYVALRPALKKSGFLKK